MNGEKYIASVYVDNSLVLDGDMLERVKKDVFNQAINGVKEKTLSENGINIKTVFHSFKKDNWQTQVSCVAIVSAPIKRFFKFDEPNFLALDHYYCVWCGSKNPLDDKYHSGTCENCGGPKV